MFLIIKKLKVYYAVILGGLLGFIIQIVLSKTINNSAGFILLLIVIFLLMNKSLERDFLRYERLKNKEE